MEFEIYCPDLALITFKVFTKGLLGNELIGWYCLPVSCARSGFRVVPLWDKKFVF